MIERFQNKFLGASVPNKSTIKRIVDNFLNNDTLEPKKKSRKMTKLSLERLSNIREGQKKSPNTSERKGVLQHGIHHSTAFVVVMEINRLFKLFD